MGNRLLHLFATANGVAAGYQRAGFHVVGVHHDPQPDYVGDEFHEADVRLAKFWTTFPGPFDVIHASVPDLGELTQHLASDLQVILGLTGSLYVIEVGAALESNVTLLAPCAWPANTEFLGRQLRSHLRAREVSSEPA